MTPPVPRRHTRQRSPVFVDRVPESQALLASLRRQRSMLNHTDGSDVVLHHVLTFFGMSGVGKSTLSERLQAWCTGSLPSDCEWGSAPAVGQLYTARWDFNDTQGMADGLSLLVRLRQALTSVPGKKRWAAFDLALALYAQSVRPGEALSLDPHDPTNTEDMLEILKGIAADLESSGLAVAFTASVVRRLARIVRSSSTRTAIFRDYPTLPDVLERIMGLQPGQQEPSVVADIAYLLSDEIALMPAAARPLIVVFIDHFERLQSRDRRTGEILVNQVVAALPFALFVIVGRGPVDWHNPARTELAVAGPHIWRGLVEGSVVDPRQHQLDMLSSADVKRLLEDSRSRLGLGLDDPTIADLIRVTGGWPVYVDAIITLASTLTAMGRTHISAEDFGGSLKGVIERLLEDLPGDEVQAFRAACLLPYFDVTLAAEAGAVDEGAVQRCVDRAIVTNNLGSLYPFRVHDQVRKLVRRAGPLVRGGWSEADWGIAAARALDCAERRHTDAEEAHDDQGMLQAYALGLNLALEHGVFAPWLVRGFKNSPSHIRLAELIGGVTSRSHPDAIAVLRVVNALAAPIGEGVLTELREVFDSDSAMSGSAGLWRCYRLRSWGRFDEAIDQARELLATGSSRGLHSRQLVVTHIFARRFVDAHALMDILPPEELAVTSPILTRSLGYLGSNDLTQLRARAGAVVSRRFGIEVEGAYLRHRARFEEVSRQEATDLLNRAMDMGHRAAEADALIALGYLELLNGESTTLIAGRLDALARQHSPVGRGWATEILALRALATRDPDDIHAAHESALYSRVRNETWIFPECVLDHLGSPLPPAPTQWLEPYDEVKARWVDIGERIVSRARSGGCS